MPGLFGKELLDLVHPRFRARVVLARILVVDGFEFVEQFALADGQIDRRFDDHMAEQISVGGGTHALDAFAAQTEYLARLRFGRDLDLGIAVEGGYFDIAAQRRGGEADRHFAM